MFILKYTWIPQMGNVLMQLFNLIPQLLPADNGISKLLNILAMMNWVVPKDVCNISLPLRAQLQASTIQLDPLVYLPLEQIG